MDTKTSDSVLYYEFEFTVGTHPEWAGTWHYATVYRVTPGESIRVDRIRTYYRWSAKRAAKKAARADLKWLEANTKDEKMVWRP